EVALDGVTLGCGAVKMGEVIAQIHHAIAVVHGTGGGDDVVGRGTVFCDVDRRNLPQVDHITYAPVDALGADHQPGRGHVRIGRGILNDLVSVFGGAVGFDVLRGVDIEANEIELAADGLHVAGLDPGSVGALPLEVLGDV